PGNKAGYFYDFRVSGDTSEPFSHFDPRFNVLDPYALAVVGPMGPAIVVDQTTLPRPRSAFNPPAWHDLVIVEAHIRDISAKAPLPLDSVERMQFPAVTQWLRDEACYLRSLGVNAVELQPLQ
ncbi:hypothetical protein RZS08_38625, partial [Arthrospira platensis SPKY1]|nr:hypothetical protein [Arthrospira platensis SPKY1]